MATTKRALVLVNLGTPDSASVADVRTYLREFLSDPRVLDMNPVGRWLLLNLIILRTRPKESAHAYEKIWTEAGSPLLVYSEGLRDKVQARLGDEVRVALAMRYQNPSIHEVMLGLRDEGYDDFSILPLYPQYASASTGSTVERVLDEVKGWWNTPAIDVIPAFYDDPAFINAFAEVARQRLADFAADLVVLSFHGLPERHCTKSDLTGSHCLASPDCCDAIGSANANCYRAQCFATARALAAALDLGEQDYEVAFQSRMLKDPWIRPYADELIDSLPERGVKRVAVMCPAFVADCLETLEEIGMRAAEDFTAAGGETLILIPSLNDEDIWADAVVTLYRQRRP